MSRQENRQDPNESLQVKGQVGWTGAWTKAGKPGIKVFLDGGFRATAAGTEDEGDGNEECRVLLSLKIPLLS
jgi:hypothetical protein